MKKTGIPATPKQPPRIGIDNYGLHPMKWDPLRELKWAQANNAAGLQFSGWNTSDRKWKDRSYLKDLGEYARANNLYIEWGGGRHIPFDMTSWKSVNLLPLNRTAAAEASLVGASIVRSCSGGLMRWNLKSPMTATLLDETAKALSTLKPVYEDRGLVMAVEIHFEFTTHELVRLFERAGAEPGAWLGVCLDTMNPLIMLEDPVLAAERILPWVVSTHIKDGGVLLSPEGLVPFPCAIGTGAIDIPAIVRRLELLEREITLSIEDHGGSFLLPIQDPLFLSKFPDLSVAELGRIIGLVSRTEEKMNKGRLSQTEREEWPRACENRLKEDIKKLKKLLGR